jgi:hypothetical protein
VGDEIIIDGFVHGRRLLGNVNAPKFEMKFGAHFKGKAATSPT